jgi:predicted amidohydrolase
MNHLKAAAVQFNHRPGDKRRNIETIHHFVSAAQKEQVDLIVFPEMCITGYWHIRHLNEADIRKLAEPVPAGASTETLLHLAHRHRMTIAAGLIELGDDGRLYNTCVVAMPDGEIAAHRKLHCFISEHMSSGDAYTVFDLPQGIRAGLLICYDNNIIENARITALRGAQILLAPHQTGGCLSRSPRCMGRIDLKLWAERATKPEAIEAEFRGPKGRAWLMRWLPARAHDNGMFLIFSNGVGRDDDEVRTGNAMIIDPYGEILVETGKAGDDMVVADLDPGILDTCSGQRWLNARRPELYHPLTELTGKEQQTRKVRFQTNGNS